MKLATTIAALTLLSVPALAQSVPADRVPVQQPSAPQPPPTRTASDEVNRFVGDAETALAQLRIFGQQISAAFENDKQQNAAITAQLAALTKERDAAKDAVTARDKTIEDLKAAAAKPVDAPK